MPVFAEKLQTKRVKCSSKRHLCVARQYSFETLSELFTSFAGKSHGHNVLWLNSLVLEEMGNFLRNGVGFSSTRTCNNQKMTIVIFYCFKLLRVEIVHIKTLTFGLRFEVFGH